MRACVCVCMSVCVDLQRLFFVAAVGMNRRIDAELHLGVISLDVIPPTVAFPPSMAMLLGEVTAED